MPPGRGGKSLVTSRTLVTSGQLGAKERAPVAGEPVERDVQHVLARTRERCRRTRRRCADRAVEADERSLSVAFRDESAGHPRTLIGLGQLRVRAVELAVA